MVNKKHIAIFIGVMITILLISVVIAITNTKEGVTVKVNSPAGINFSGGNYSGVLQHNNTAAFNVTFVANMSGNQDINGTAGLFNATFWINISAGNWVVLSNSTHCITHETAAITNNFSCSVKGINASATLNGTTLPDGYYTVNASIYNGSTFIYPKNQNMTTMLVDSNVMVNTTNLNSGNNHSTKSNAGNLTFNISIADMTPSNIDTVMVNIINNTGTLNDTLFAVREGQSMFWSLKINTTHFPDGKYNLTIGANDTLGNFNTTANSTSTPPVRLLIFDNTIPSVSATCTAGAETGEAFPCSCSTSDATAGLNSSSESSTSPDNLGTPALTGSFTYSCSATDRAGNTGSASATYSITDSGAGSSGGGSGGSSSGGSSGGSGGSGTSSSNGSVGAGSGSGASGQGTGAEGETGTGGLTGSNAGWVIGIIIVIVLVVVIVFYVKKKKM